MYTFFFFYSRYFTVIKSCWQKDPNLRPTFQSLIESMDEIVEELMPNYKAELEHELGDYYYSSVADVDSNGYTDLYNADV